MKGFTFKLLYIFISISYVVYSQTRPIYANYLFNGLVINPAYAGQADALSLTLTYRNQWVDFDGSPKTLAITAHTPLINKHFATGLVITYDQIGISNTTEIFNSYAFRFNIKKTNIAIGMQIGGAFMQANFDNIEINNKNDPNFQNISAINPKYGAGLFLSNKRFFAGISLPSRSFLDNKYPNFNDQQFYYGGYNFFVTDNFVIKPSVLLKNIKNINMQADLNLLVNFYKKFNAGISYRIDDAVVFLGLLEINKQISIGYSYDYTISNLRNHNKGSHEILLRYDFKYYVKDINPKIFK